MKPITIIQYSIKLPLEFIYWMANYFLLKRSILNCLDLNGMNFVLYGVLRVKFSTTSYAYFPFKIKLTTALLKRRLGAQNIQQLPLLAAWAAPRCSHGWHFLATEPWSLTQYEKQVHVALSKQWRKRVKGVGGEQVGRWVATLKQL